MSALLQTTPPAFEPVSVPEAKGWLRVDSSEEDALILGLIAAARGYVEMFTRRALCTQSFELSLDAFPVSCLGQFGRLTESRGSPCVPASREIILPRAPLASVESLKYYDENGTLQTQSSAEYFVDTRNEPGRIVLNQNFDWPATDIRPNAVIIAYTCGYGTPSSVPPGLRAAIRFLITHWFINRTPVNVGNIVNEVPLTVEALLWQFRLPFFA